MKPFSEVQVGLVRSYEDVEEFMRWLSLSRPVLAVDTETAGLDGWAPDSRVRLIQFGDADTGWAIDYQRWSGLAHEVLARYTGRLVFHNAAFDLRYMAATTDLGTSWWDRVDDTMIAARCEDSTRPAGLKPLGGKYVSRNAVRGQEVLDEAMSKNKWTWNTVPIEYEPYWQYAGMDVIITARLWEHFASTITSPIYQLENAVNRTTTRMEIRGARVDLAYSRQKYDELEAYVESMLEYGAKTYGFKLSSPSKLAAYLIENGAVFDKTTPSGAPSADAEVLELLAAEGWQVAKEVLSMRKADKLASTYFRNIINLSHDSIIHPQINSLQARTGRMSIQGPALQTLPKSDKTVRKAFIADSDDHILLTSDLDQVEFRLFAALAEADGLRDMFTIADSPGGLDVFTQIGRELYNDTSMTKSDPRRATVKTMIYSRLYGAGVAKQAASAGVPVAQMKKISNNFEARFPEVAHFQGKVAHDVAEMTRNGERAYVMTPYGAKLFVDDEKPHAAINYLVQGTAASVMKQNLLDLENAGLGEYMIVPVHDEIVMSVPRADLAEVKTAVRDCMTTLDRFSVPLPAGISLGESWGSTEEDE